jgi:hypothetical protein
MPEVASTSIARELGRMDAQPSTEEVRIAAAAFVRAFSTSLGADIVTDTALATAPRPVAGSSTR